MEKQKNPWLVWLAVGLASAAAVLLIERVYAQDSARRVFAVLSDAFFVPGMLYFSLGLLHFVTKGSMFDMLSFGGQRLIRILSPVRNAGADAEFRKEKERRKKQREQEGVKPVVFVEGIGFILVSLLFLLIRSKLR